jgi:hypothetical protein
MKVHRLVILAATIAMGCGSASNLFAQDNENAATEITARVRATFLDGEGGLGVLSGDLTVVRFEVRRGTLTAITRIVGALADGAGRVRGQVAQELAIPVSNVTSTCNQLRMDLASTDADVLQTFVHFDGQAAGFDSRDGSTPKALGVLCAVGELLRGKPAPETLAGALNAIVVAVKRQ